MGRRRPPWACQVRESQICSREEDDPVAARNEGLRRAWLCLLTGQRGRGDPVETWGPQAGAVLSPPRNTAVAPRGSADFSVPCPPALATRSTPGAGMIVLELP